MKRFFLTIAACFAVFVLFGQSVLPNDSAVRVGRLDNGLTYYIRHNDKPADRAEFYLATNVGAFQEEDDQEGLAHFLEHMCFNGTKNFPGKGILEYLQSIGAEFGRNINASTGFEQTSYMLNNIPVVREGIVDSCLLILHDYSRYVTCDPAEIDAERGVILEERRSRRNADWRMFEKSLPYYYGDTQMARRTLIGREEQLKTFKYESLTNFYRRWYNPDMQAVVVVGDIDVDKVEQKIKTIFGSIPAPEQPTDKPLIIIPENKNPHIGIITDPEAARSEIQIMWRYQPMPRELRSSDVAFVQDIVNAIIANVMNERFDDIVSSNDAPFLAADFRLSPLCNSSDAVQGIVVFKDGRAVPAFNAFMTEVERLKRYGFTVSEIERAKGKIIGQLEKAATAADTRSNDEYVQPILNNFFFNSYYLEPAKELELAKAVCMQLSDDMIQQMVKQLINDLTAQNCVVISTAPERENIVQPTENDLLTVLNEVKNAEISPMAENISNEPLLDAALLKGAKSNKMKSGIYGSNVWTLKNGVKVVMLKTDYKKDQILLRLVKDGGRSLIETDELPTFDANIWNLFINNKGLSTFSGTQLRKMLVGKNVSCQPFISSLQHGISVEATPQDFETALQLLYLNIAAPRFDADEFELVKNQISAMLPNLVEQPSFKFQGIIEKTLYNNNPRRFIISDDVLAKADISTLERVYRRLFSGVKGATLYVVGNVDVETVKPLIEKYVGSMEKGKSSKWIDRNEYYSQGVIVENCRVDMETPKSTVFHLYTADIPYSVKNEVMLDACRQILEMVFVETLRESEGGTYGAGVATMLRREPKALGGIQVVFETNPSSAEHLSKMAHDGVVKLAKEGVPADKLNMVIENFKKNRPEERIDNRYWIDVLREWNQYGIDYDSEYADAVGQINSDNIVTVLNSILAGGNHIEILMQPKE